MERTELEQKVWDLFEQGLSDNEILNELVTNQEESLTFMELRILRAEYEDEHPETLPPEEPEPEEEPKSDEPEPVVTLDVIKKPGAILSGKGNLPSGAKITWLLDQTGRISIAPEGAQEPTEEDLQVFQQELRSAVQKSGGMM